jgi:hypothetical protein
LLAGLETVLNLPSLDEPELVSECLLQTLQVLDFLNAREVGLCMEDLLDCQYQARSLDAVFTAATNSMPRVMNQLRQL